MRRWAKAAIPDKTRLMEESVGLFHAERRRGKVSAKHKRAYSTDIYKTWVRTGKLEEVLSFITDCARKLVTQTEMCKALKMDPRTFSTLKKNHPDVQEAIDKAKFELKKDLASAMYRKAVGYETVEEDQYIEDKGGKQVRKVHRTKKQVAPDYKALTYLLTKHFGKEYYERYLELALLEKKAESRKETWSDSDASDESEEDDGDGGNGCCL